MTSTVTAHNVLPLAVIDPALWCRVSAVGRATGVSVGDDGHAVLPQQARQPGNSVDWTAVILILMMLADSVSASDVHLHIAAALLLIRRIVQPCGSLPGKATHPLRLVGRSRTILAMLDAMVCRGAIILDL